MLGAAIGLGALGVYLSLRTSPVEVSPEHYEALKARLDYNPRSLFCFDEDLSYLLKPRFVGIRQGMVSEPHHTNSRSILGTREVPSGDSPRRILFLGDSVTYGDRVPFPQIFTSRIQELAGDEFFIANAGCPGWSTHQEIAFFEKYLADVDWAAVVLVFCLNDLVRYEWVYENDGKITLSEEMADSGGIRELSGSVRSLRLRALVSRLEADPKTSPLADQNTGALIAFDETRWERYEKEILTPGLKGGRIPNLIVVAVPSIQQLKALRLGASAEAALFPQHRLAAFCEREHIPFIDASRAFAGVFDQGSHYLDLLHLGSGGHRRMAKFLWPEIRAILED